MNPRDTRSVKFGASRRRTGAQVLTTLSVALAASTCASDGRPSAMPPGAQLETSVTRHDHTLAIHAIPSRTHETGPLILFVTGDGGWDADQPLFDELVSWGYPTAGFSAPDYASHLPPPSHTIDPRGLTDDYLAILASAEQTLHLGRRTRVVLVGFSRGSGLDVAAAIDSRLRRRLAGLLTVALTGEEEHVYERPPGAMRTTPVMFLTYEALPRLGSLPVAVIQLTRDEYLPAAEAVRRFGPDTPVRWFKTINAVDHGFSDKLDALHAAMKTGFDWILKR